MPTWIWFVIAGICLIAELFSGTFYLLIIGIAFGLGGVASLVAAPFIVQLIIVLLASVSGLALVRNSRLKAKKNALSSDADLVLDLGQKVKVDKWQKTGNYYTSTTKYRGASWQVLCDSMTAPVPGTYTITGIDGNILKVKVID